MTSPNASTENIFLEADTQIGSPQGIGGDEPRAPKHPYALGFHVLFKLAAVLAYLLCGFFNTSFVTDFVIILLLVSADFWTTKNITGRLLVGLRWWNYVDDDGKSHWVFESRGPNDPLVDKNESRLFWAFLVAMPCIWGLFGFIALFTLRITWLTIVAVAMSLSGSNLYGYLRCRLGKSKTITGEATSLFGTHLIKNMFTSKNAAANLAAAAAATSGRT